jgi:hypothetical protein
VIEYAIAFLIVAIVPSVTSLMAVVMSGGADARDKTHVTGARVCVINTLMPIDLKYLGFSIEVFMMSFF